MSDTPRTECYVLNPFPQVVSAEWARQLERELNAANDRIQSLIEERDQLKEALLIMENLLKPGIELFPEIGEILKQGAK